jgi:uncharacterized protein YfaS (alpha-2-macroglobulin family)
MLSLALFGMMNFDLLAFDYTKAWKDYEVAISEGRLVDAKNILTDIYSNANKENRLNDKLLSSIKLANLSISSNENGVTEANSMLLAQIDSSKSPYKNLAAYHYATFLNQYLQNNYFEINARTETSTDANLLTATKSFFQTEIAKAIEISLSDLDNLNQKIDQFPSLISNEDSLGKKIFPTLKYLLLQNAFQNYANGAYVEHQEVIYKDDKALSPYSELGKINDSLASTSKALDIIYKAMSHASKDKNTDALAYFNLERLSYLFDHTKNEKAHEAFIKALFADAKYFQNSIYAEDYYLRMINAHKNKDQKESLVAAKKVCDECIKVLGPERSKSCKAQLESILKPELNFKAASHYLPQKPIKANITSKNLAKVYFKILSTPDYYKQINYNQEAIKKYLNGAKEVRKWTQEIKQNPYYRVDDVTFDIESLPLGTYVIVASNESSFNEAYIYSPFQVTNLSYMEVLPSSEGEFIIVDRITGKPVEGANVEFFQNNYDYNKGTNTQKKIFSAKSSKEGKVKYQGPMNNSFELVVTKDKDKFESKAGHYKNNYRNEQLAYNVAHVYTDRAIYRPGQTVYFKAILTKISPQGAPTILPNQKIKFDLIDANGQLVSTTNKTTNDFGSCSETFVLPVGKLTGSYQIMTQYGGASIQVEEYKRPTFEILIDSITKPYKLGDKVMVTGLAKTYAAANIANAPVKYRITKSKILPYCYRYYYFENSGEDMVDSGVATTDAEGKFKLEFLATPSFEDKLDLIYSYTVTVDVLDETGESQSASSTFYLSKKSKFLSIDPNPKLDLADKLQKTIFIKNIQDKQLEGKGKLTISKLKEVPSMYEKNIFENDSYNRYYEPVNKANEQYDQLKVESVALQTTFTSGQPIDLGKMKPGIYRLEASSFDNEATPIKEYLVITDIKKGSTPATNLVHIRLNKPTFKPNEAVEIDLATPEKSVSAYYILSKNDKIIQQGWVDVKNKYKIKYNVKDVDQGNLSFSISYVFNNRFYKEDHIIEVPWINKYFDIKIIELRDKSLPGSEQKVKIKLIPKDKTDVTAEVLATMYDASLDQFVKHGFNLVNYPLSYNQYNIEGYGFNVNFGNQLNYQWANRYYENGKLINLPQFIDLLIGTNADMTAGVPVKAMQTSRGGSRDKVMAPAPEARSTMKFEEPAVVSDAAAAPAIENQHTPKAIPSIRTNLKESVFFYPHLTTDKDGNLEFTFKNNEALTKWRLMLLAHNKELTMAFNEAIVTTHKDVMIQANSPRFIRIGDELYFTARVSNLSEKNIDVKTDLSFTNANDNTIVKMLDDQPSKQIKLSKGEVKSVSWKLKPSNAVPDLVKYVVFVESGNITDAESAILPVLSNKVLVTESLPMYIRAQQTKSFTFAALQKPSPTQISHKYVVEVSSNPVWYAIQAMPYITGSSNDLSVTGLANKYYINYLASHLTTSNPEIEKVYKVWQQKDRDALKSKLQKNEELKYVTLDETPWVKEVIDEALMIENIAQLFDRNNVKNYLEEIYNSLQNQQLPDGSYPWYPGGRYNYYSTKYVVNQLGNIHALTKDDERITSLVSKSLNYLDKELNTQYNQLKEDIKKYGGSLDTYQPSPDIIHHLYTRSLFANITGYRNEGFNFYYKQAIKYWNKYNLYTQAQLGFSDFHYDKRIYKEIQNSIMQRSFKSDELGIYWNEGNSYNWYEMPIERHAMIMQLLNITDIKQEQLDEMKIWLLKNKQGNKWNNSNATAAAINALMLTKGNKQNDLTNKQFITMKVGEISLPDNADIQAGTSYYKKTWEQNSIIPTLGNLSMKNQNTNVSWGSAYFQYFEEVDKVKQTSNTSPLKIKKAFFIKEYEGKTAKLIPLTKQKLKPGDILVSRIIIETDRNMEFIHLKDLRGSGCEPVNKLSQYKYSGSFGYYESTRDQATHYYIDLLPKGTHVFESSIKIVHRGSYAGGLATIQSFYAPEFSSKTEGNRIVVE